VCLSTILYPIHEGYCNPQGLVKLGYGGSDITAYIFNALKSRYNITDDIITMDFLNVSAQHHSFEKLLTVIIFRN
jgi:hypothetical protein